MNKICTTIEQAKELIELGIDKYITWDMCYLIDRKDEQPIISAWSLSALHAILWKLYGMYKYFIYLLVLGKIKMSLL